MSLVTVVNDHPVLRPGLLVHSFSLNRGSLTPERLDRALREGITGGYYDNPDDEDALFMSIHGFDREYNASIGGEYGITRPGRTSGIALIFKEELNSKIRHQELIPDEAIDAYLQNKGKDLLRKLGIMIGTKDTNRPETYSSTILDLYATQKMCDGDYLRNIETNQEDGVRAFEIKDRVAVPLRVMPGDFEGLLVSRYFELDGVEMPKVVEPYVGEVKIGNVDALQKLVDGRIPILMYCESRMDIPKDALEVHEITPFGYIPINTRPDGRDGRIDLDLQRRHYIARL